MTINLPDFLRNNVLNALRYSMGASLSTDFVVSRQIKAIELPEITLLREEGIDIDSWDDINVLSDGTLSHKNHRVLLYIRDFNDVHGLPKFHAAFCSKLVEMKNAGRWGRYVIANREDGRFAVSINKQKKYEEKRLDVCRLCLDQLQWHGYSSQLAAQEKNRLVREFSLPDFFRKYPRDLFHEKPKYTSDTAPVNEYPANWKVVSMSMKRQKDHRCEACGTRLIDGQSKYLHVHHKNGQKNENNDENLEVLCVRCHAEKPLHGHMKSSADYISYCSSQGR